MKRRPGALARGGYSRRAASSRTCASLRHEAQGKPPSRIPVPRGTGTAQSTSKTGSAKRKRGAPTGNQNAFKHGFYSRQFTRKESKDLDQPALGCMRDEIIFLKVIIDRNARRLSREAPSRRHLASRGHEAPGSRDSARSLSFHESVLTLQVVAQAISRLNSLYHTNRQLDTTGDDQIIEFLRERGFTEQQIRLEVYGDDLEPPSQLTATHGFYASHYTPEELERVSRWTKQDLLDELPLLRILIKRTYGAILHHEKTHTSDDETDRSAQVDALHGYRVLIYAISCLERLERNTADLARPKRVPQGILNRALQEFHSELTEKKSQGLPVSPHSQSP